MSNGRVLLITGPAGSGKSTLAQHIAQQQGWIDLSEDSYWLKNGWGSGLRSEEQENKVQKQLLNDLVPLIADGRNVVLEFILYKAPPNPLTAYQTVLTQRAITFDTIVLSPPTEEILKRLKKRGRPDDIKHLGQRRKDAENQIRILDVEFINPEWVIDPTNMTVNALSSKCLARVQ